MRNFLKIETNSLTKREFLFTNFDNAENKTNQKNINMFLFLLVTSLPPQSEERIGARCQ